MYFLIKSYQCCKLQYSLINFLCGPAWIFSFWTDILDVALGSLAAVKATTCIQTLSISSHLISLTFSLLLCSFAASPLPFPFSCSPSHPVSIISFSLPLSLAPLSFLLFPFEVLNNERATLPVKLIGKSRRNCMAQCSTAESCPRDHGGMGGEEAALEAWPACSHNDNGFTEPWSSEPSPYYISTAWLRDSFPAKMPVSDALIVEPWQLSLSGQDTYETIGV